MNLILTEEEVRVLGVLAEKQMATPEYYPMSLNAVKVACNQKSNREPVVEYQEATVLEALDSLRRKGLALVVSGGGSRVRKYEHKLREALFLNQKEQALLAMLMLRGPQTLGELRSRTDRMAEFADLAEVEETLRDLSAAERSPRPLAMMLPRMPGQKESRYVHLLSGEPDLEALATREASAAPQPAGNSRLTELEEKVEMLSREIQELKDQFQQFKRQFE